MPNPWLLFSYMVAKAVCNKGEKINSERSNGQIIVKGIWPWSLLTLCEETEAYSLGIEDVVKSELMDQVTTEALRKEMLRPGG
jgi:hypothetical protein